MATKKQELIAFKILDKNGTDIDGNKFEVGKKYTTKDLNESSETDTSPIELLKGVSMMRTRQVRCILSGRLKLIYRGVYKATELEVVEEVDPLYLAALEIERAMSDDKMPKRVGYTSGDFKVDNIYSSRSFKKISSGFDGALISLCSQYSEIRVSGNKAKVSSSGYDSFLYIGGERNVINSTGDECIIVAWGRGHYISVGGENSTVCAEGEDIAVSSSDDFVKIITLGINNRISTTGDEVEICSSGYGTIISSTGEKSIIKSTGKNCMISACGDSIVSAGLGSWITLTRTKRDNNGNTVPVDVVSWCVDGECIFPDVYYRLGDDDFEPVKISGSIIENIY